MRPPAALPTGNAITRQASALLLGLTCMLMAACDSGQPVGSNESDGLAIPNPANKEADPRRIRLSKQSAQLFAPLPQREVAENQARVDLGRMLFFDPRLSKAGDISCNSCHQLTNYGVDNQPTSAGHEDRRGTRNSPTVYNAALHESQFWDGRASSLIEQIRIQVLNPAEMAMPSEGFVVAVLATIPGYVEKFQAAFPQGDPALSFENMAAAIASFEQGLLTPDRFDAFMKGELNALSDPELNGLETFIEIGCASCHSGPALGGNMFRKMGLVEPYPSEDQGRFAITGNDDDRHVFKVPGLRNVAKTAPYLHDGSVTRLVDSVHLMARHQLGLELSDADAASISMFLESLTGTPDADYIAAPDLPAGNEPMRAPDAS